MDITADGKFLLVASNGGTSVVVDTATRAVVSTGPSASGITVNGANVLVSQYSNNATARYTITSGGVLLPTGQSFLGAGFNATFAPDGAHAIAHDDNSTLFSLTVSGMTLASTQVLPAGAGNVVSTAFSPTGNAVYARTSAGHIVAYSYNPTTGAIGSLLFDVGEFDFATSFYGVDQLDVSGNRVYTHTSGGIVALDATTGANLGTISLAGLFVGIDIVGGVVVPTNAPPVANNDSYSTNEDQTLSVLASGVLGNDTDADSNVLSVATVNGVAGNVGTPIVITGGTLTVQSNGSFTFVPNANFNGVTSFTYTATDGAAASNTATVTINIASVNDAPVANPDSLTVTEKTTGSGNVLANDTDVDEGDTKAVSVVNGSSANVGVQITLASGALVTVNADGSYTYNPNNKFRALAVGQTATDTFTYTMRDAAGATSSATVTVTITGVNDAPVALTDNLTAAEDGPGVTTKLVYNDVDNDDTPASLTVTILSPVAEGTVVDNHNGRFTFLPGTAFQDLGVGQTRMVQFTYRVTDSHGASDTQTIYITVVGTNDAPTANPDSVATTDTVAVSGNVLTNDTDVDAGDTKTVTNPGTYVGAYGTLVLNANGTFTYTPTVNANGTDTFAYTMADGSGATSSSTLTVVVTDATAPRVLELRAYYGDAAHPGLYVNLLDPTYQRILPWFNIKRLDVVFSEGVNVDQGDLALTGINVANYGINSFAHTAGSNTASWVLSAPIGADRISLNLDGDSVGAVVDLHGNKLAGNGTNTATDFIRSIAVLPGDYNNDGVVNLTDQVQTRNAAAQSPTSAMYLFGDMNGDGVVNITSTDPNVNDVTLVRSKNNTRLPI